VSLPRYRNVRYVDDGCYEYQCLSCYATWEWRYSSEPLQFCMCCGIRFEGQHECREHTMPRWRYEYAKKYGEDLAWRLEFPRLPPPLHWAIEEKTVWVANGEIVTDWHVVCVLRWVKNARLALAQLNAKRHENDPDPDDPDDFDPDDFTCFTETFYRLTRTQ